MRDSKASRSVGVSQTINFSMILLLALGLCLCGLFGCSDSSSDAGPDTGSITFSLKVAGSTISGSAATKQISGPAIDCAEYGIETIEVEVLDETGALLGGGSWTCNQHEGLVSGVKSGTNRAIEVLMMDADGAVVLAGREAGITVIAGQTTNAGTIAVEPVYNMAPVLDEIGPRQVNEGEAIEITLSASDPNEDSLTYYAANLPSYDGIYYDDMVLDPETHIFTWQTPAAFSSAGNYKVLFIVTDNGSPPMSDHEEVTITVDHESAPYVNQPPVLNPIGSRQVATGDTLEFTVSGADPEGDSVWFSDSTDEILPAPENYSFNSDTGLFRWRTYGIEPGNYYLWFSVWDEGEENDSELITITLGDVNRPPVFDPIGNRFVENVGDIMEFVITAIDPDGDSLTFYTDPAELPSGASFNPDSQLFIWDTTDMDEATYYIEFTVTDDGTPAESDSEYIAISLGR